MSEKTLREFLDEPRQMMYDELQSDLDDIIEEELQAQLNKRVTELYDNKDQIQQVRGD